MNGCEQYREQISELLDGELAEPQKTGLESHLAICPECRRVYQAFALISSSLENDMAEPPEELAESVMNAVRSPSAPPAKKTYRWAKVAALAAVFALVILAGTRFGFLSRKGAAQGGEAALYAAKQEDMTADTAEPETTYYSLGSANNELNELQPTPMPEEPKLPAPAGGELSATQPPYRQEAPSDQIFEDESQKNTASLSVRVFSGDASPAANAAPLAIFSDEDTVELIMDMLSFSAAGDDIVISGQPTFIVEVDYGDGVFETISAYIIDGRLCCVKNGAAYVAAGDITDLIALIAAA